MKMFKHLALSFATVAILLTLFSSAQGSKCGGRGSTLKEKRKWKALKTAGECRDPVLKAVPVEIDGYELMTPNTVMLNRCEPFHGCKMMHCLPKNNITREIRVEGWPRGMKGRRPRCVEFKTFEHEGCKCACSPDMCDPKVQVYDMHMCKCNCMPKLEEDCNSLIDLFGSTNKMFNPNTCECDCLKKYICASGEWFDPNMCKCRKNYEMMAYGTKG